MGRCPNLASEYNNPRRRGVIYVALLFFAFLVLLPLYVLVVIAFGDPKQTLDTIYPALIPSKFTLVNFVNAFRGYGSILIAAFYKSLETAFIVGALAILLGFHASFGLSKLPYKISGLIIGVLFFSTMIPSISIAVPISVDFLRVGFLNETALGLALAQELTVLPLTVFLIMGAFQTIPKQLEQQARVDGATFTGTLYGILFPLAIPGIISAFLLSWLMSWDEFTFAIILSPVHPTLPILIYVYGTGRGNILTGAAFSLLVTIPVIILTIILSRFIKGNYMTAGITG